MTLRNNSAMLNVLTAFKSGPLTNSQAAHELGCNTQLARVYIRRYERMSLIETINPGQYPCIRKLSAKGESLMTDGGRPVIVAVPMTVRAIREQPVSVWCLGRMAA